MDLKKIYDCVDIFAKTLCPICAYRYVCPEKIYDCVDIFAKTLCPICAYRYVCPGNGHRANIDVTATDVVVKCGYYVKHESDKI